MQIRKMKKRKMRLDMRKLSNEACRKDLEAEDKWLENCGEDEEFLKREGKRLHRDMLRVTPVYIGGSCSEKDKTYQGWESVAGLQDVIQCLKEVIILPLLYPELFNSLGLTPPRGVLLHGYPGTGKTLVVRALIGECARGDKQIAYFARKGADCLGKYVGDAERQLRLLFQVAERCQPSIIFFDEIDGLAPCRSKQQDQTHNSVVSTLLSLLDGLKSRGSVVVIGATNRPDAVDPALRRPGRFDREIYFPLPSVKDRSAILSLQTKNWPKPLSGRALSWIANQTAGYAGADLQVLCTQAAMIGLKRNCPLHEILVSAEKGSSNNRQPSLPAFTVEEKDWLAALACAPPPCSQREAGMAANGVVTSPLPTHLVPCLLQPLSYILISFCFDERIWIPPALFKASKSIKDVISSALQQMNLPIRSWKSYLHELIKRSDIAKEIERNLSCFGLLSSASPLGPSCTLDDDNDDEHDKFTSQGLQIPRSCIHNFTSPNVSVGLEKRSGFRVLIAGAARCGQQHLAACLLHQFLGRIEIQKVNLATVSQEGRGDIIRGLTQIILKCVSLGRCVVYMPRIDLWAVDEDQQNGEESTCHKTFKSAKREDLDDVAKHSSQAWDCFVEQLDSLSRSSSLIILATCEMENHDLPVRIREFFMSRVLENTDSSSSECTIPRFPVQVDGNFEYCLMISSAVTKISCDIVEQYVQLIHKRSHEELIHKREATGVGKSKDTDKISPTMDSERISSNHGASLRDGHAQELVGDNKRQNPICKINQENAQRQQDSLSRVPSNRITRGNSMFMIATLGYQILQYPQFAELCWVTSKLKEGPCADISGPWTVWPFNSCIVDANKSTDKAACPLNPSNVKDKENPGLVRGLVAVGLLAYRGAYTSVREVSFEVRKVLELLVKLISFRIQNGKDRYRFVRLLSQVAYLDDMVNSWAYTFQSLQIDNRSQTSGSNGRPMISGEVNENNDANSCMLPANDASMSNNCNQSCDAIQEMMQIKSDEDCAKENGECSDPSSYIIPESEAPHDMLPSAPLLVSCPDSSNTLLRGEETCRSENPGLCSSPCKGLELPEGQTGLPMTEDTPFVADLHNVEQTVSPNRGSMGARELCDGLGAVNSSTSDRLAMNEQVGDTKSEYKRNGNSLSFSETLCLFSVCSDCLQSVHVLTQEILIRYLKSSGHSPTVDDVHEIVTTCSLNLVAVIRKHFFSQSCCKAEGSCSRGQGSLTEDCVSQDVDDTQLKKISESPSQFEHIKFFPNECGQHQRDKEVSLTKEKGYDNSPVRPELEFLFKDGILLPSNPQEDVVLHCSFKRLSIQTIIEILSSTKEPCV
ncbi:hypothetical protein Taro_036590 [Colocasia esculenta]|uniref:AAA+ ATPase domain-containing protein n=1 Tax=Colocasia esculenta TaxID=4460 RepID=A0A843W8U1_COLES|nr:hypothetical protein [Colocasia esculenta]